MPYAAIDPSLAQTAPVVTAGAPLIDKGETLASMREEILLELGGRDDVTDDRVDKFINWAYLDLWTSVGTLENESSYSFGLVAGQPLYLLPSQVRVVKHIAVAEASSIYGGLPLEKIDLTTYRSLEALSGTPRQYFRHNNVLVFYPTPESATTVFVEFVYRPLRMTLDNHSPILPEEWHESIVLAARKKLFSALMEFDKATHANNDFVDSVRRREDDVAGEDSGKVIRSSIPRSSGMLQRSRASRPLEPGDEL
jgi:hypothetical protein